MKKSFSIMLLLLAILFNATSCKSAVFHYDYDEMKSVVERIEIVFMDSFNPLTYRGEPIKLTDGERDELLLELSKIEYKTVTPPPSGGTGYYIKLYYANDEFGFINYKRSASHIYNNEGYVRIFVGMAPQGVVCPKEDFDNLIAKFINIS